MSTATKTKTTKREEKKEFNLERFLVLWLYKSKNGKTYLSGKTEEGVKLTGFLNKEKQNPKEPDIKIYTVGEDKKLSEDEYVALWVNATDNGKKYLSGKVDGKRVVGFFNSKAEVNGTVPYINVYFSDDAQHTIPVEEEKKSKKEAKKTTKPEYEEVEDNDLPF